MTQLVETQKSLFADECEPVGGSADDSRKLSRRGDPGTSQEAAASIDARSLEDLVCETIASFGDKGCISDQVRKKLPKLSYSSVTARYRALLDDGRIVDTGKRVAGASGRKQRVMRAIAKN